MVCTIPYNVALLSAVIAGDTQMLSIADILSLVCAIDWSAVITIFTVRRVFQHIYPIYQRVDLSIVAGNCVVGARLMTTSVASVHTPLLSGLTTVHWL